MDQRLQLSRFVTPIQVVGLKCPNRVGLEVVHVVFHGIGFGVPVHWHGMIQGVVLGLEALRVKGVGRGSVSDIFLTHGCSCRSDAISKLTERTDSFTHHLHIFLVNGYQLREVQHPTVQLMTSGDLYPRLQRSGRDVDRVTVG